MKFRFRECRLINAPLRFRRNSGLAGVLQEWQADDNAVQHARKAIAYLQLLPCCNLCLARLRLSEPAIVPGAPARVNEEGHTLLSSPTVVLPGEDVEGHGGLCELSGCCAEVRLLASVQAYQIPVDNHIRQVSVWVASWRELTLGLNVRGVVRRCALQAEQEISTLMQVVDHECPEAR